MDSSQIEFDFNESSDESKNTEINKSISKVESQINSFELNTNEDSNNRIEKENLNENSELENFDEQDLEIKIKDIQNDDSPNDERIEVDIKNETPFDNSIEKTIKNSYITLKRAKKFNYSFQNSINRTSEMDNQPAIPRI